MCSSTVYGLPSSKFDFCFFFLVFASFRSCVICEQNCCACEQTQIHNVLDWSGPSTKYFTIFAVFGQSLLIYDVILNWCMYNRLVADIFNYLPCTVRRTYSKRCHIHCHLPNRFSAVRIDIFDINFHYSGNLSGKQTIVCKLSTNIHVHNKYGRCVFPYIQKSSICLKSITIESKKTNETNDLSCVR